jgi:hypothetical protein
MHLASWQPVVLIVALGCTTQPAAQEPPPARTAPPPVPSAADEPPAAAPTQDPWDPATPVEPSSLTTHTRFVVAPKSAVCPTREQAEQRACGHSVEDVTEGTRAPQGSSITVVGDAPVDGMWKALRYQKAGILPAWIRADDVAERPSTDFLDAWDRRAGDSSARDVGTLTQAQLAKVPKGTMVQWRRSRAVKYGEFDDSVQLYLDLEKSGVVVIALPAPNSSGTYVEHHACLVYGDCVDLSYQCDESYCDEVSILARATGKRVTPPTDPRGRWSGADAPVFESVVIADRYGLFEQGSGTPSK